jgi:beta-glucanase (GH16 family)
MGIHRDTGASPRTERRRVRAWAGAGIAAAGALALATAATVANAGTTPATQAAAQPAAVPAPPAGFTLTWSDDFTGGSGTGVDTGAWKYDTGPGSNFGTGEIETMTDSTANVFQDGSGHLVLKALHAGTDPGAGWTSGRIETQAATFGANAGGVVRMEASIQQPDVSTANGAGYWPAFWMLGSTLRTGTAWPTSGEVDILEDVNGRSSVFGTLHCGVNPGGPCNESSGLGSGEHACAGCQTGFHNYAVEIDRSTAPEQIRWYLDGANYFTLKADAVDAATWTSAVDHPFFIIFDLAMGGGFPAAFGGGPTAATISGGQMTVDYVAVYNKS